MAVMLPGPAISGMASGTTAMSWRVLASSSSGSVMEETPECLASKRSAATINSRIPPAVRKAGSPTPSSRSNSLPPNAKANSTSVAVAGGDEGELGALRGRLTGRQRHEDWRQIDGADGDEQRRHGGEEKFEH